MCRFDDFRDGWIDEGVAAKEVCVRHYKEVMGHCGWPSCEVTYGHVPLKGHASVSWYCQLHHGTVMNLLRESDGWIHDCSFLACPEVCVGGSQSINIWWIATQARAQQTVSDMRAEVLRDEQQRQARNRRTVLRNKTSRSKTA